MPRDRERFAATTIGPSGASSLLHEIFDVAIGKRAAQVLPLGHQDYQRLNFRHLNATGRGFVISTTYQPGHDQSCNTTLRSAMAQNAFFTCFIQPG